jgi:hypothetical protein
VVSQYVLKVEVLQAYAYGIENAQYVDGVLIPNIRRITVKNVVS